MAAHATGQGGAGDRSDQDAEVARLAAGSPNFGHLLRHEPPLVTLGCAAESYVHTDAHTAMIKANVLFFERKPARPGKPWSDKLWVYDFRTAQHFTLKQNPLTRTALEDFVQC